MKIIYFDTSTPPVNMPPSLECSGAAHSGEGEVTIASCVYIIWGSLPLKSGDWYSLNQNLQRPSTLQVSLGT